MTNSDHEGETMEEATAHLPGDNNRIVDQPGADALFNQHAAHWQHRDRSGAIIPFSEQPDPWVAFRTYRAISWLRHAERHADHDVDAAFIFLWIAFDCSYGSKRQGERPAMRAFFHEVLRHGRDQIYDALWSRFAGPVRVLLSDEYLFQPHLDELSGAPTVQNWKEDLARRNDELQNRALPYKNRTLSTLDGVFDRLYCLRNQLFHGGAKWGSTRNRESVRTGRAIMAFLVPVFIGIMLAARKDLRLGEPRYYLEGEGP